LQTYHASAIARRHFDLRHAEGVRFEVRSTRAASLGRRSTQPSERLRTQRP